MKRMRLSALLLGGLLLGATPAFGQEDDPEAGDQDPVDVLDPAAMKARQRAERPTAGDPDADLHTRVESRRRALEEVINRLQTEVTQPIEGLVAKDAKAYDKVSRDVTKLVASFLKETEKFVERHRASLEKYRGVGETGALTERERFGKDVVKEREAFLKSLDKLSSEADKLRTELNKIQAKGHKPAPPEEEE